MNWAAPASLASDPLLRPCPWAARAAVTCQPTPGTPLPLSILAVHQGFELYGSDRVFLQTLDALRERHPNASLTIVLPRDGALADVVRERFGSVTIDEELAVLRRRELGQLGLRWLVRLARGIRRAMERMRQHDLCLINTVTVADYLIASRFQPNAGGRPCTRTGDRPRAPVLLGTADVRQRRVRVHLRRRATLISWYRPGVVRRSCTTVYPSLPPTPSARRCCRRRCAPKTRSACWSSDVSATARGSDWCSKHWRGSPLTFRTGGTCASSATCTATTSRRGANCWK
jgi:hypothetical protein